MHCAVLTLLRVVVTMKPPFFTPSGRSGAEAEAPACSWLQLRLRGAGGGAVAAGNGGAGELGEGVAWSKGNLRPKQQASRATTHTTQTRPFRARPPGAPRPADHQVLHLGSVGLGKPQAGEAGGVTPVFLRSRPHNNRAAPRAGGGYRGGRPARAGGEEGCTHRPAPKGGCVRAWPRRAARAGLVVLMSSGSKRHGMAAHSLAPTQAIRPAP